MQYIQSMIVLTLEKIERLLNFSHPQISHWTLPGTQVGIVCREIIKRRRNWTLTFRLRVISCNKNFPFLHRLCEMQKNGCDGSIRFQLIEGD